MQGREEGGGIEVQVTIIMKCIIISSRNYSGLLVLSHPMGGLIIDTGMLGDRWYNMDWGVR